MRSNKTIGTNRLILGSITLLVFVFWILDVVMRQLPSPIPIWWTREIIDQLILSSSLDALWRRPWTLVTYSLLHNNGMHLLLNLLLLWLFGQMLLRLSTPRQFGWCYVGGAVVGGIAFVLFTSLLRVCGVLFLGLPLVGASASVVALVGYMIGYAPRQEMPLPLTCMADRTTRLLIASTRLWGVQPWGADSPPSRHFLGAMPRYLSSPSTTGTAA